VLIKRKLEELNGKQFTANLETDSPEFLWRERPDVEGLNLMSTSGIQKMLLNFSREMLTYRYRACEEAFRAKFHNQCKG